MPRLVIFGGTTEGRQLAEALHLAGRPALICVATDYGAKQIPRGGGVEARVGRMDADAMLSLLSSEKPPLVVDATHPYAKEAGANIRKACRATGIECVRVRRESQDAGSCVRFSSLEDLVTWLSGQTGVIFAATGSKEAQAFTALPDYKDRVFLRILPSTEALSACLFLGYPARRVICMQGPFSQALNEAMFQSAGARILVTKDSGAQGGFAEKLRAARALGMQIALLTRPVEANAEGQPLGLVMERILRR